MAEALEAAIDAALAKAQESDAQELDAEPEAEETETEAPDDAEESDDVEETEEKPDEEKPEEAEAKPDDATTLKNLAKAKKALKRGDALEAAKLVFGEEGVKALKLDSKQWAKFRRETTSAKRQLEEREGRISEYEGKLRGYTEQVQNVFKAREAYEAGDFNAAIKLAFGEEEGANGFYKKHRASVEGRDPRVSKLERELQEFREAERRREEQAREAELSKAQQEQVEAYIAELGSEMAELDHEGVATAAKVRAFRLEVYRELDRLYSEKKIADQEEALDLLPEVAEKVYNDSGWADVVSGRGPSADRAAKPERRGRRSRNLNSNTATEVSPPGGFGKSPSLDAVVAKYSPQLRDALLRENR